MPIHAHAVRPYSHSNRYHQPRGEHPYVRHFRTAYKVGKELWKHRKTIQGNVEKFLKPNVRGKPPPEAVSHKKGMVGNTESMHSGVRQLNLHIKPTLKRKPHVGKFCMTETFAPPAANSVEGQQGLLFLGSVGNADNYFLNNSTLSTNATQSGYNYFSLNPDIANSSSALFGAQTNLASNESHLVFAEFNVSIRNLCSVPIYADVYCVEAKKHIQKPNQNNTANPDSYSSWNAINVWDRGLLSQSNGLARESGVTPGALGSNTQPDSRPQQCTAFKENYKIKSVHHMTLASAAEETLNYHCPLNMHVKGTKLIADIIPGLGDANTIGVNTASNQIRVATLAHGLEFFVVFRGAIVKNNTTPFNISYAPVEIAAVIQRKIVLAANKSHSSSQVVTTGQNTLETGAASANLRQINEVDQPDVDQQV